MTYLLTYPHNHLEPLVFMGPSSQMKQSRFWLLSAVYSPEELCRALPAWITEVETDESARGVPSTQYWTQVQGVLEGDCILGCSPLVAPAAFARALRNMGSQEGRGHSKRSPSHVMFTLF